MALTKAPSAKRNHRPPLSPQPDTKKPANSDPSPTITRTRLSRRSRQPFIIHLRMPKRPLGGDSVFCQTAAGNGVSQGLSLPTSIGTNEPAATTPAMATLGARHPSAAGLAQSEAGVQPHRAAIPDGCHQQLWRCAQADGNAALGRSRLVVLWLHGLTVTTVSCIEHASYPRSSWNH